MRTTYTSPSVEEFAVALDIAPIKSIRGGSLSDIEIFRVPSHSVRGGGLFNILSGLARRVVPFLAKTVAPSALEFGQNVIADLKDGNATLKQSLRRRGVEALGSTARRIMKGRGRAGKVKRKRVGKGKRKRRKRVISKKNTYKDVFSMM